MDANLKRTAKAGWSEIEKARLFSLARDAQEKMRPLKTVFDDVARETGRMPNSVRNFYYAQVRGCDETVACHRRAFIPFAQNEAAELMETILTAQAAGESVRACTLRLADGDDKRMLRYQNKYRAMLKHDAELVKRIVIDLNKNGVNAPDPYAERGLTPHVGRPRKQTRGDDDFAQKVVLSLCRVPGLDARALFSSLGTLALAAVNGTEAQCAQSAEAERELAALRHRLDAQRARLLRQNERYRLLLSYFTQLVSINQSFLSLNSVVKVNRLSDYIRDLETNVRSCEQLMQDAPLALS